jgi:hypothetical protein
MCMHQPFRKNVLKSFRTLIPTMHVLTLSSETVHMFTYLEYEMTS